MDDMFIILISVIVFCVLSGPAAFVMSLIALNRTKDMYTLLQKKVEAPKITVSSLKAEMSAEKPVPVAKEPVKQQIIEQPAEPQKTFDSDFTKEKQRDKRESVALEQKIGTQWLLIAGIITFFAGIGFFLKYAYDNFSMGPMGRVIAVTVCGLILLLAGEITRRRGYDIVAKGVTALGFAILYIAVFAAYQVYGLIGYIPAFIFASAITIAAMICAVALDEVLIAFLSLLGGFSTPVLMLSKITSPVPLFVYILILGTGAMLCAYYRRWRAVNFLSFSGTFIIYTIWFDGSEYNSILNAGKALGLNQVTFVLGWLGVFFIIYLVLPVMYVLVNKVKSSKEEVLLILTNAAVVLYYLCAVLFDSYRSQLAFAAVILSLIYFAVSAIVNYRCKEDINLRLILPAIGIFFITLAIPLYFKLDATTIAWACESLILVLIGLRYSSLLIQAGGIIVMLLSILCLLIDMPMHSHKFNFILNPEFGTWCFVSAAIYLCHLLYRRLPVRQKGNYGFISQFFFGLSVLLLFAAGSMEWYYHCKYNLLTGASIHYLSRGQLIIFAAAMLMFVPRFIRPAGIVSEVLSWLLIAAGSVFTITALANLHTRDFIMFANIDFAAVFAFLAAILICQIKYRKTCDTIIVSQLIYGLLGLLFLSAIAAEWYWHCNYNISKNVATLLRGLIIIFAVVLQLFVIRPIAPAGIIPRILAIFLSIIGAMFTIANFFKLHNSSFLIFLNANFGIAILFVTSLFFAAWLTAKTKENEYNTKNFAVAFVFLAIFTLWITLSQEIYLYWYCRNKFAGPIRNWEFFAQMYISVMWAIYAVILMITGFWRKIVILRYIGISLFAILLIKVFLIDTQEIKSIYRVTAFLVTGVTLVGVSYLYQYLKKTGFFDSLFTDKTLSN